MTDLTQGQTVDVGDRRTVAITLADADGQPVPLAPGDVGVVVYAPGLGGDDRSADLEQGDPTTLLLAVELDRFGTWRVRAHAPEAGQVEWFTLTVRKPPA